MALQVNKTSVALYLIIILKCFMQCIPGANSENVTDIHAKFINRWQLECLSKTNADPNDVMSIKSGHWDIHWTPHLLNNIEIKKWALCVLVSSGVMSPEGVFKIDDAFENVPVLGDINLVTQKVDSCLYKQSQPPYEIAWHYIKCYNKNEPKKFKIL